MISNSELLAIIAAAKRSGATVVVTYCSAAAREEGRKVVEAVEVSGLKGCGPHPMPPIAAAERLRECLCKQMAATLVAEIVQQQALCAVASGAFNADLANGAIDGVLTKASDAQARGSYEPSVDPSVVLEESEAVWNRLWEEVTLLDCSRSTTQRSVRLCYQGKQIEGFDNSICGYPNTLDLSKKNPWEKYSMEEFKPILVKWMAQAQRGPFEV